MIRALVQNLTGAAKLAADSGSYLRLTADFLLYYPMKFFRPPGFNRERTIRVRGGITITYRLNRGDIWALHEVWIREIYRLPLTGKQNVIVDLGANIGLTALYLAKRYNCSRLIAVEPVPANAALARRNLEQNNISAEVIEAAVGSEDGTAVLQETVSSTNSTVAFGGNDQRPTTNDQRPNTAHPIPNTQPPIPNTIPVVSMKTALHSLPEDTPIDLIKMDIEGSEGELLSGNVTWLKRARSLIAEFHPANAAPTPLISTLEQSGLKQTQRDFTEENIEFFIRTVPTAPDNC